MSPTRNVEMKRAIRAAMAFGLPKSAAGKAEECSQGEGPLGQIRTDAAACKRSCGRKLLSFSVDDGLKNYPISLQVKTAVRLTLTS